jgi:hypothetical protein
MSERRLTDAEIAATDANVDGSSMPDVWKRTIRALLAEVRAHRAASGGGVSCVQCAQNDDCPGFDACPWLPRGEDDVAGALRDLLLSADCTWESNNGGHDWREACEAARAALALHRSGSGAAVRAVRSLVSREDFWRAVRATGTVLPGEYDDLVDALRTAGSGDARETELCQRWTAQIEHMKTGVIAIATRWASKADWLMAQPTKGVGSHARQGCYRECARDLLAEWDRLALAAPSPDAGERGSAAPSPPQDAGVDEACVHCGHAEARHNSPIANGACEGEWERCGCHRYAASPPPSTGGEETKP